MLATLGILILVSAASVRDSLLDARTAIAGGRLALVRGDFAAAERAFHSASWAFIRARGSYRNPLLRGLGYLPLLGRSPDAVAAIIDAGSLAARAGAEVAGALRRSLAETTALPPRDGVISLEHLKAAAAGLANARRLLAEASQRLDDSPDWLLLPTVDNARDEMEAQLNGARDVVKAAAAVSASLPEFLGSEGVRRYFIAAQNPAELRGTGGLIGAYAILTANGTELRLGPFHRIERLASFGPNDVNSPNPDYARRYGQFGGAGLWQNLNMTPDFPSAAIAIERLYERSSGMRVDGVIAADPFALREMLAVTGSVRVRTTSPELDDDNVVQYITNEAYEHETNPVLRKRLFGDVVGEVLRRFLRGGVYRTAGVRALVRSAAQGHLLLHAVDPTVQAALIEAGADGSLPTEADLLAVIENNAAGNKADHYLQQELTYAIELGAEGSASAETILTLTNDAPSEGEPAYVIGPYDERFEAGQNVTYLSTYCGTTCRLESFRRDGSPDEIGAETELGHPVYPSVVDLASGDSQTLEYLWTLQRAWRGDGDIGVYRLRVRTLPTVRPTRLEVDVRVPQGMYVAAATAGMRTSGGRAVWRGDAEPEMKFEVRFERPALARVWHALLDFLRRPIVTIGSARPAVFSDYVDFLPAPQRFAMLQAQKGRAKSPCPP